MKITLIISLLIFNALPLFSKENKFKISINELNSDKKIEVNLLNNHVLFIKPKGIFKIKNLGTKHTVSVFFKNNSYPFTSNNNDVFIKAPSNSNVELQVYINTEESVLLSFSVITAIEDKNIHDGYVLFNKKKYIIGSYSKFPKKPSKVKYFKKTYAPPKWFLLWNNSFINRPISKHLKYKDLVTVPKPLDKKSKRPTEIFTCCYKVMNEFDNLIDKSFEFAKFKKVRVLSFYRTPKYNKSIKSGGFSRHIFGDAIDFFIDEKAPFMIMDDLNLDKKKNLEDGRAFFKAYKNLIITHKNPPGGMGIYFSKKGASIHYDSRGHLARWAAVDKWWPTSSLPKELKKLEDKIKLLKEQYEKSHSKKKKSK